MSSAAEHDSTKLVSPEEPAQDDIPLQAFLQATPAAAPVRTIYQYAIPEYHAWRFIRPLRRAVWHQKDRAIAVFMVCMIHSLSALFFCYTVPWLLRTRSVLPLVFYIPLYLFNTSSWVFTLLSDPGILPRGLGPGPSPIVPPPLGSDGQLPDNYPFLGTGGTRQLFVGERVILTQKWCVTCHLWRPPRASHCSLCDACIDRHDHHCPWLSNCIGSRNYRFFVAFVASLAAMAMIAFTTSVLLIVDEAAEINPLMPDYRKAMANHVGVVILLGGTFIFGWTPLVLTFYHLFLSLRNRTTHEAMGFQNRIRPDLKSVWRHTNPFHNLYMQWCRPREPSWLPAPGVGQV